MTDESKTNKAGTGVARHEGPELIHPAEMILNKAVAPAQYRVRLNASPGDALQAGDVVPLETYLAGGSPQGVGVVVRAADDLGPLREVLDRLPVVALHFAVFSDGRAYSHAWRLRKAWGYKGTLLACGDVLRDQLLYMSRVGINAFYMRADQKLQASLAAFSLYTEFYQYDAVAS